MTDDQFYKTLMDHLYDDIYFVDRERRITYWNKGAERITGHQRTRVVGTFCHDNLLNHVTESRKKPVSGWLPAAGDHAGWQAA